MWGLPKVCNHQKKIQERMREKITIDMHSFSILFFKALIKSNHESIDMNSTDLSKMWSHGGCIICTSGILKYFTCNKESQMRFKAGFVAEEFRFMTRIS